MEDGRKLCNYWLHSWSQTGQAGAGVDSRRAVTATVFHQANSCVTPLVRHRTPACGAADAQNRKLSFPLVFADSEMRLWGLGVEAKGITNRRRTPWILRSVDGMEDETEANLGFMSLESPKTLNLDS